MIHVTIIDVNPKLSHQTSVPALEPGMYKINSLDGWYLDVRKVAGEDYNMVLFSHPYMGMDAKDEVDFTFGKDEKVHEIFDKNLHLHKAWALNAYTFMDVNTKEVFTKSQDIFEDYIKLNDGRYLMRDYGKYASGLCFISSVPTLPWVGADRHSFNIASGANLWQIRGNFFKSKKDTDCFEINEHGKHILLKDSWGGCFNRYRGHSLPDEEQGALYFRRASSNGGGAGCDYAVLPISWTNSVSIENI